MPTVPVSAAGWRMEPPVSVAVAPRQRLAATAAAEPPDEPPGVSGVDFRRGVGIHTLENVRHCETPPWCHTCGSPRWAVGEQSGQRGTRRTLCSVTLTPGWLLSSAASPPGHDIVE